MNKAAPAEQAHTTRDTAAVKSENTPDRPVSISMHYVRSTVRP